MENKFLSHKENIKYIDCMDIYVEETERRIKTLKRFREEWLRSFSGWNTELFQYADLDFYFYRFAIERQEKSTEPLLLDILYRVIKRYGLAFDYPENRRNAPFAFIICEKGKRIGYTFSDFNSDADVNGIIKDCRVDEAFIIRTWKHGRSDQWITRENNQYQRDGLKLKAINVEDFFKDYFAPEEYSSFQKCIEQYLKDTRDITGYKSIKFLSSMNLATQKTYEEKILSDWQYKRYRYQIINKNNRKIQNYLYLSDNILPMEDLTKMEENYVTRELFKSMLGSNEYAESFITSEWLYHSLKEKKNFDYTAVISGYLKSIEQLLHQIVMLNVDNGCKISMSGEKKIREEAKNDGIVAYKYRRDGWKNVSINPKGRGYLYIDLTAEQVRYMDSSIGAFEHFLRNNPHIFDNQLLSEKIADMVCCFRTECRNGFFHTHNLTDWDIVEKTRSNAIYLYFILLGACIIPQGKNHELGIGSDDEFDELCKKIREFGHYNSKFIFEYADGRKQKLIYDFINNTVEYTDDGIEHYQSLLFYAIDEFSLEAYEKLDESIREEQKVLLTRDNLPSRIFGVHRNHEYEEIDF